MTPITPQQYQQSEQVLSSFLGHTKPSQGEAYRVLRALEVATVKDLDDNKVKINDENILFYRTALQNQRDAYETDLREFISESLPEIFATDKKKNAQFNWKMFQDMVRETVFPHLELQFGDIWNKQNYKFKIQISDETAISVLAVLRKDKNVIRQVFSGIKKEEQDFINQLFALNFNIPNPDLSIVSIATPIISEIIFLKKMGR
jgi:hypothetical protein